jgi:adhesin transport system outer membrane protein
LVISRRIIRTSIRFSISLRRTATAVTTIAALAASLPGGAARAETMAAAVRAAVTSNPAAQAENANVRATALELLGTRREYLPTVNLTAGVGGEFTYDPGRLSPADDSRVRLKREVGLTAELVIFDGYRRANLVYARAAQLDGSIFRLLDASETMALNAVETYIDVIRHRELLAIARQIVVRYGQILVQVRDLVDAGRLPVSDRFELEGRLLAARQAVLEVEQALENARARYAVIVGHPPSAPMSIPPVGHLPASLQILTRQAVENSYRVRYADSQVEVSRFDQGIERSQHLPQVKLRAGATYGWDRGGTNGPDGDAFVGVQLNWQLYSGGRNPRAAALTERTREALAERHEVVREVHELAARAWNAYRTGIAQVQLIHRQVGTARKLAEQYAEQFEAGSRSLLEVMEAERALFNYRFERVSAEASLAFAQFRILAAQGRLASHFGVAQANMPLDPYAVSYDAPSPLAVMDAVRQALE